jgi:hypothetical protein
VQAIHGRADTPAVSNDAPVATLPPPAAQIDTASLSPAGAVLVDDEVLRERKLHRRREFDATRTLDGWERYRALVDATDEAYELIDISNRETRFALILMGALNAGAAVLLTRVDAAAILASPARTLVVAIVATYGILALAFLLLAIEALRPGHFRPRLEDWPATEPRPAHVRYHEDVIQRSAHQHWRAWQDVRLADVNAELAVHVHSLALKNNAKHVALRRLYLALRIMTLMLAALMVTFGWLAWS